jgi:hypothetical protein
MQSSNYVELPEHPSSNFNAHFDHNNINHVMRHGGGRKDKFSYGNSKEGVTSWSRGYNTTSEHVQEDISQLDLSLRL